MRFIGIISIAVLFMAFIFFFLYKSSNDPIKKELPNSSPKVYINKIGIEVEVADTPQKRAQGLSGRKSLGELEGMLFIFENPDIYRFWMPDMNFPIDIIWIDEDGVIVDITENAPPLEDKSNPVWYMPIKPVKYVLEVNSGFSNKYNINVGDKVIFSL
jgi:uncharacterized membrane protein (UPF0127 family)